MAESYQTAAAGEKKMFRYMRKMAAEESCLQCHGDYAAAPRFVQQLFPPGHPSYNYQVGEVIGAVSVGVPMTMLYQGLATNLKRELLYRIGILLIVFASMWFLVRKFITGPILLASGTMNQVTRTGDLSARITSKVAKDEIGGLISGFNEMMEELERANLQRRESEDRYRGLIEAAQTAIVTFLENGKIVISNRLAENFLGLPRHELLGKSIFDFLENQDALREKIVRCAQMNSEKCLMETTRNRIHMVNGPSIDVEVTLILASKTEHAPMFTVIIAKI